MGSYATWRAAILVFMYPQNILDPTLRAYQTPGFQTLVTAIQANPALTPDQACQAACAYLEYFEDVCTLQIAASREAPTQILTDGDSCSQQPTATYRNVIYLFAAAGNSGKIYWSTYDPSKLNLDYRQTFWDLVPGFAGEQVTTVVGAARFLADSGQPYLCLFAIAREGAGSKLILTK